MALSEIDRTDREILRLLQENAEFSNKELAHKLNKSLPTIHERIRKLKETGFIKKVVALLDKKKVDRNLIAFSQVVLSDHTAETLLDFEREVARFPEVMECFQMAGSCDFLLRIATADMDAYQEFYRLKLSLLPRIITINTFFVLTEIKSVTAYPI
ncbi:Lrp/AsnC family transcriptional regulator [Mucilaginibacter sabulilitoris]|uniref:Lrp/AsnC family transcriptional regulator n=1 Tax=Mucilaginibacter sabulilitoris TaxID=1173583 RepID=A0ABZ0TTA8_9SPHI|nr:Lrp/AsnC family transcriptional regulator [Mucilaginibacter sabulilitoris]WPU94685.1 Lrp/AsnC family transcriptional regulator [Mucilaginibacter sabulilitoris]